MANSWLHGGGCMVVVGVGCQVCRVGILQTEPSLPYHRLVDWTVLG